MNKIVLVNYIKEKYKYILIVFIGILIIESVYYRLYSNLENTIQQLQSKNNDLQISINELETTISELEVTRDIIKLEYQELENKKEQIKKEEAERQRNIEESATFEDFSFKVKPLNTTGFFSFYNPNNYISVDISVGRRKRNYPRKEYRHIQGILKVYDQHNNLITVIDNIIPNHKVELKSSDINNTSDEYIDTMSRN